MAVPLNEAQVNNESFPTQKERKKLTQREKIAFILGRLIMRTYIVKI